MCQNDESEMRIILRRSRRIARGRPMFSTRRCTRVADPDTTTSVHAKFTSLLEEDLMCLCHMERELKETKKDSFGVYALTVVLVTVDLEMMAT